MRGKSLARSESSAGVGDSLPRRGSGGRRRSDGRESGEGLVGGRGEKVWWEGEWRRSGGRESGEGLVGGRAEKVWWEGERRRSGGKEMGAREKGRELFVQMCARGVSLYTIENLFKDISNMLLYMP